MSSNPNSILIIINLNLNIINLNIAPIVIFMFIIVKSDLVMVSRVYKVPIDEDGPVYLLLLMKSLRW